MRSTIERLYGQYDGATISVVGSGPSAVAFDPGDCDISIGVNGAALLGRRFDYFLCMTQDAHRHDWFDRDCSAARVIGSRIAMLDYRLYPPRFDQALGHRRALQRSPDLPEPAGPHHIFVDSAPSEQGIQNLLERRSESLMTHGTTAGQAVQLAFLMGAGVVRLYGCSFSADSSGRPGHYFYDAPQGQCGWIDSQQACFMDLYLSLLRRSGTRIVLHGESALSEFDRQVSH